MIVYYGSYSTTDGKEYLMGYDEENPSTGNVIITQINGKEDEIIYSDIGTFDISKEYYKENKNDLLKKYKDKYIAIIGKKIVDSDKDFSELIKRVYKKYGYKNIYIPFVEEKEKIVNIPSPILIKYKSIIKNKLKKPIALKKLYYGQFN